MFGRKLQVSVVKDEKPGIEDVPTIVNDALQDPTNQILIASVTMTLATGFMALVLTTAAAKLIKP